jgi:type I restriction enzyme, S subunit
VSLRTVLNGFPIIVDAPNQVVKLRELFLQLGVRGELTERWRTTRNLQRKASWKTVYFFDFCVLQRGYDLPLSKCDDGRFPIVTSAGIAAYHSEYKATGPGVVVGRSGSIGKVFYIEENFWPHNTALYVRDFKGNYPRYVYYYLLSFKAAQFSKSTAVPTLNRNNLRGVQVDVPSFDEQKQIVLRLEELMQLCDEFELRQQAERESRVRLNAAILAPLNKAASLTPEEFEQATTRLADNFDTLYDSIDTVSKLRATILQLAMQGKLIPQDRNNEPGHVLLRRIRADKEQLVQNCGIKRAAPPATPLKEPMFDLPLGWTWARFGDVFLFIEAGWSPECKRNPATDREWGVLKVSSVSWDNFRWNENKALPGDLEPRLDLEVKTGDFLISRANTSELVAKSVVVKDTRPKLMISDKVLRVHFSDHANKEFYNFFNNSQLAREYYARTASGTSSSMKNISQIGIALLPVPVPPLEEQRRIVAKVNQLISLCDELEDKLRQAEADSEKLMNAAVKDVLYSVRDASQRAEEVFA